MSVAGIRNSAKVRELATELRDRCALADVHLVAGEAEEIVVKHVQAIAAQLGLAERTVLTRYMGEAAMDSLVTVVASSNAVHVEAASTAAPVVIGAADVGAVVAALGMSLKLAAQELEHEVQFADALGVTTDAADAIVGLGAALRGAPDRDKIAIGGPSLVYARKVLWLTIDHLRDRTWACSCRDRHEVGKSCSLQKMLARDLGLIGGWPSGPSEPAAGERGPSA